MVQTGVCLAQVQVEHVQARHHEKNMKLVFIVVENIFYNRKISLTYDLKGSRRSRYNTQAAASSDQNVVLLDENLLETMSEAPILVEEAAKRQLEAALYNDSEFLAELGVMDYSLLLGVDAAQGTLVVGIIDYVRQYTWDKQLETYVKSSGVLGGGSKQPTIISPKLYKKRFRRAIAHYLVTVPGPFTHSTSMVYLQQFMTEDQDDERAFSLGAPQPDTRSKPQHWVDTPPSTLKLSRSQTLLSDSSHQDLSRWNIKDA